MLWSCKALSEDTVLSKTRLVCGWSRTSKKMPFDKHLFKAHCKNQRCGIQYGWPTGNWTSYLCCIIALLLPLMLDRITRRAEIVWFHQCQGGCRNCPFWGLYLMPSLGCSKCTKTSDCLWSRLASCCPKKKLNKWQQGRKKVTLSRHSFSNDCYALTSAEYFLTSYISLVIFRW